MADDRGQRVREVVADALDGTDVDLEDVSVRGAGRRRLVEVVVDADGGITLDDVAEVSRRMSRALDDSGVMGEQAYVLEVGSPGVARPLMSPRHWRRNVGRLVRIRRAGGGEPIVGRIEVVSETGATLGLEPGGAVDVRYDEIEAAVVQVELGGGDGHRR